MTPIFLQSLAASKSSAASWTVEETALQATIVTNIIDPDGGCDPRSAAQKRHDILGSILDTASREKDLPRIGGIPPAIMLSVREEDLSAGTCAAYAGGIDIPISIHAAAQRACTAGIQKVTIGASGQIIQLGAQPSPGARTQFGSHSKD